MSVEKRVKVQTTLNHYYHFKLQCRICRISDNMYDRSRAYFDTSEPNNR